jgi:hypothetical protein
LLGEQIAEAYRNGQQQASQTGVDTERRTLATRAIAAFFATPIAGAEFRGLLADG